MKYLLLLPFLLFSLLASAQNEALQVRYLQQVNSHAGEENAATFSKDNFAQLAILGNRSTYRYGQGGEGKKTTRDDNNNVSVTFSDARGYSYHTDRSKGLLLSRDMIMDQAFLITEKIPDLNWTVLEQTKEIGGYTCRLATTSFRGRDYSAWFTPEIPLSAGPWKLSGLPGLILEANDAEGVIKFTFGGLKRVPATEVDWNTAPKGGIPVSFEQFFLKRADKEREIFERMSSIPGVEVKLRKKNGLMEPAL